MINSLPRLQIICTFILIQTMPICAVGSNEILQNIFKYDFKTPLSVDSVLIWKISGNVQPFTPLQYTGEDVLFSSEETYLLFAHKSLTMYTVYYWYGKNTSLMARKAVAMYAVLLSQYKFGRTSIAREFEGMETDSFQLRIKTFNKHAASRHANDFFMYYLDQCFPSPRPNLYAVRGDVRAEIKKVPLSLGLQWLKHEDGCLVVELEYKAEDMLPMNYLCGIRAHENLIDVSENFANDFYGYFSLENQGHRTKSIDNHRDTSDFKRFLEILEDSRFYNPYEVDDSDDHLKDAAEFINSRDGEISLFGITNNGLQEYHRRPDSILVELNNTGYVIDTKSVAGVFLIFFASTDIGKRIAAIQLAEEYLEETYPLSSKKLTKMRIVDTLQDYSFIVDLKIHFSDFPYSNNHIQENEFEE